MRNSGALTPTRGPFNFAIITMLLLTHWLSALFVAKFHHNLQVMTLAAQVTRALAETNVRAALRLTVAKNFSLHGSGLGVVPVAPGGLHLAAPDNHAPIFRPRNNSVRRADWNDNDLSGALTDRC